MCMCTCMCVRIWMCVRAHACGRAHVCVHVCESVCGVVAVILLFCFAGSQWLNTQQSIIFFTKIGNINMRVSQQETFTCRTCSSSVYSWRTPEYIINFLCLSPFTLKNSNAQKWRQKRHKDSSQFLLSSSCDHTIFIISNSPEAH